jgi:hypothetical protein
MKLVKTHYVRSQSDDKIIYNVNVYDDGFATCDCIFYQYKGYLSGHCKHIDYIRKKYYATTKMLKR